MVAVLVAEDCRIVAVVEQNGFLQDAVLVGLREAIAEDRLGLRCFVNDHAVCAQGEDITRTDGDKFKLWCGVAISAEPTCQSPSFMNVRAVQASFPMPSWPRQRKIGESPAQRSCAMSARMRTIETEAPLSRNSSMSSNSLRNSRVHAFSNLRQRTRGGVARQVINEPASNASAVGMGTDTIRNR